MLRRIFIFLSAVVFAAVVYAQTPTVPAGGVLNGASFDSGQGVAPGSLVSIFGTELSSALTLNDTVPLSVSLHSVSVKINDIPAGLYFVSAGQINVQVPWNVLPSGSQVGGATLVVTRNGTPSAPQSVNILPEAPGVFATGGWAIAINSDGTLAAPANAIKGLTTHPTNAGQAIIILCTGLGAVTPTVANGASSKDKLRRTVVNPQVLVGGATADLLFSGLAPEFPGVNQVNATVPPNVTGNVALQLQVNGLTSTDQTKIAVE